MEEEVIYNVIDKKEVKKEIGKIVGLGFENELGNEEMKKSVLNLKKPKALFIYDLVKVKVLLNEHFYILSRHMIARMLMLCLVYSYFC